MLKSFIRKLCGKIYSVGYQYVQERQYNEYRKTYSIDPSFRFNGDHILFYGKGEITIGSGSYIGEFSTVLAYGSQKVVIGSNCAISHNVRMYTQSAVSNQDFSKFPHLEKVGDILIGDHVWIGANVFINPGVKIGDNSIVGANSVVTTDVLPFSIVGGVPAKLIKMKEN